MKRHLAIYSSPRPKGFSSAAHDIFISAGKGPSVQTGIIRTHEINILPCTGCGYCADNRGCSIRDDMDLLYDLIRESEFITISSPLYFSSIPGPLKNIIDRCQVLWEEKRKGIVIRPKTGALIIAAGSDLIAKPVHAVAVIKHFFNTINCPLPDENIFVIGATDGLAGIQAENESALKISGRNFFI